MTVTVDVAAAGGAEVGEGPFWLDGTLLWTDIPRGTLFRSDLESGRTVSATVAPVLGAVVPTAAGEEVVITDRGFELLRGDGVTLLAAASSAADERMNDGKCDRYGRFWAGQTTYDFQRGRAALWSWEPERGARRLDGGLTLPNGLGWSLDDRWMYLVDSIDRCLYRYRFDLDDGVVDERVTLRRFESADGLPDGMAVDESGCLWVAFYGGGCLHRLSPDGEELQRLSVPVTQPTSCCFGGRGTLFVTTATDGLSAAARSHQPLAGSVLRLDVDIGGGPVHRCATPSGSDVEVRLQ